ncbi:uncharacterized protein LOC142341789 isoform X3 [Convolutriloba macropyga]|uniref:uncharacterized protein LOC142341789 isoform X3 n=1 Tax=Convolutriloba macropyga TaxID=536237 RepID=UPI003F52551B
MAVNVKQPERWGWVLNYMDSEHIQLLQSEVETAYKFYQVPCPDGPHASANCKTNIACVTNLGQDKVLKDTLPSSSKKRKTDDTSGVIVPEVRDLSKHQPMGLKNLGATCYVNCFLQLWYHDKQLRNLLFSLDILVEKKDMVLDMLQNLCPQSEAESKILIILELRRLFALMLKSERPVADPTPFLTALGVGVMEQQDASEFSQLLLFRILEEHILKAREMMSDQAACTNLPSEDEAQQEFMARFYGSMTEEMTCHQCNMTNGSSSVFTHMSLNITNCKSLADCFNQFFMPEVMEGSNQVFCDNCGCKVSKTRRTSPQKLPKVLYLDLMRFQWQLTGRVKSKQKVSIPLIYDFSSHLPGCGVTSDSNYHLVGAIFHIGTSSTSGHYISSIKTSKNGPWIDFNDQEWKSSTQIPKLSKTDKSGAKTSSKMEPKGKGAPLKKVPKINTKDGPRKVNSENANPLSFSSSEVYVLVYVAENYRDSYFRQNLSQSESLISCSSSTVDSAGQTNGFEFLLLNGNLQTAESIVSENTASVVSRVPQMPVAREIEVLPVDLQEYVDLDIAMYRQDIIEATAKVKDGEEEAKREKGFLAEFALMLPNSDPCQKHSYAPTSLIRKFLQSPSAALSEFDPNSLDAMMLCEHRKLSVKKLHSQTGLKRISAAAAEILSNAGFKLPSKDDICNTCVTESVEKYVMDERLKNEWKIISKYLTSGTITQNVELLKSIQRAGLKEASLKLHTNGVFDLTNETESQPESHNFVEGSETGSESYDSVSDFDTKKSSSTCSIQSAACYIVNRKLLKEWKNIRKAAKYSQILETSPVLNEVVLNSNEEINSAGTGVVGTDNDGSDEIVGSPPNEEQDNQGIVLSLTEDLICTHHRNNPDDRLWALVGEDAMEMIEKFFCETKRLTPLLVETTPTLTMSSLNTTTTQLVGSGSIQWKSCSECVGLLNKEAELSEVAKQNLKPFVQALKSLKRSEELFQVGRLQYLPNTSRLYVVPSQFIEDFSDFVNTLKLDTSTLMVDLARIPERFLSIDASKFYCGCAEQHQQRRVPVHVDGAKTGQEQSVIDQFDLEYFIISEMQKAVLESLNIGFSDNAIYFERTPDNELFVDGSAVSSIESSADGSRELDDGGVLGGGVYFSTTWRVNVPFCVLSWLQLCEKFEREQYVFEERNIYVVSRSRLDRVKEVAKLSGKRHACLTGSFVALVSSRTTVMDVKIAVANKYRVTFPSCIELSKYDINSQSVKVLEERERSLEFYQIKPQDHLMWRELECDPAELKPDTDANYRETGFAGSNLLSGGGGGVVGSSGILNNAKCADDVDPEKNAAADATHQLSKNDESVVNCQYRETISAASGTGQNSSVIEIHAVTRQRDPVENVNLGNVSGLSESVLSLVKNQLSSEKGSDNKTECAHGNENDYQFLSNRFVDSSGDIGGYTKEQGSQH